MKLALVLGCYFDQAQGGAELQARYLEREAMARGWTPHHCFVSTNKPYTRPPRTPIHPIPRSRICHKIGSIYYPYAMGLLRRLRHIRPDIVYQRGGLAFTGIAAHYAQKSRCKFVFHVAHDLDVQAMPRLPWKKPYLIPEIKLIQYGIKKADVIIAQTNYQARLLNKNYNRQALVIPNGHPVPKDTCKPSGSIDILWIANWKPMKRPELFIKLAKELNHLPGVRFFMMGRHHSSPELVRQARANQVNVLGELSHDRIKEVLSRSHLLVNTSRQEGFSNTFIEAWMRRVPVVSLSVDPDNILPRHGLGICSGSFRQMVRDVEKLSQDRLFREQMGHTARIYAEKHFSLKNLNRLLDYISR